MADIKQENTTKWKKIYDSQRSYRAEWEQDFPWIIKAVDGRNGYCTICSKIVTPRKTNLKAHDSSAQHKRKSASLGLNKNSALAYKSKEMWKKKKNIYEARRSYLPIWESEFPWIEKASDGINVFCKICSTEIGPKKSVLRIHSESHRHISRSSNPLYNPSKRIKTSPTRDEDPSDTTETKVTTPEKIVISTLAEGFSITPQFNMSEGINEIHEITQDNDSSLNTEMLRKLLALQTEMCSLLKETKNSICKISKDINRVADALSIEKNSNVSRGINRIANALEMRAQSNNSPCLGNEEESNNF